METMRCVSKKSQTWKKLPKDIEDKLKSLEEKLITDPVSTLGYNTCKSEWE